MTAPCKAHGWCAVLALICVPAMAATVEVGNQNGWSASASGPAVAVMHLDGCQFSLPLAEQQSLTFVTPHALFIEAKRGDRARNRPYLWQAQTNSGYAWSFRKPGARQDKWFGLMCDSPEYFSFQGPYTPDPAQEYNPAIESLRQDSEHKCPATLTGHGWVPSPQAGPANSYVFKPLQGANWSGFIFGFRNPGRDSFGRISFCLVHGDNVLLGAAENDPQPLELSPRTLAEITAIVSSITFP